MLISGHTPAAGVGALATLALEGLGTAAAGALAAVAEQGVAGEQLCLPCAVRAGGVAGALTVLTLGVGRVPAVQRFAGRMGAWLGESRAGLWAKAAGTRALASAQRLIRRAGSGGEAATDGLAAGGRGGDPALPRPVFTPKKLPGTLEDGAIPGTAEPRAFDAPPLPAEWPPEYDLAAPERANDLLSFSRPPDAAVLPSGTRMYRIIGESRSAGGSYWTLEPPPLTEGEWRAGWAVQNGWNGDGAYVEHTVGEDGLLGWRGPAGSQDASLPGYMLSGGRDQVWVPRGTIQPSEPQPTPWNR